MSDRIARALNRSRATRAVALDISKDFDKVWHAGLIGNIAIYADDTTLYSKCDQASDLWQQLELASELESDLRDTVGWMSLKMDESVLEEKNLLKC